MSIVNNDIRLFLLVVLDEDASEVRLYLSVSFNARVKLACTHPLHLSPSDRTCHDTVAKHSKSQEGQRYALGKEDAANEGWHVGKRIANTSDDEVLKRCRRLDKRAASLVWREISLMDELERDDKHFVHCQHQYLINTRYANSPMNGSAGISHLITGSRPICISNWGVRKTKNAMQSRYDI